MSGEHGSPFPHDGEHGRSCTGYGCDCDEKTMVIMVAVMETVEDLGLGFGYY